MFWTVRTCYKAIVPAGKIFSVTLLAFCTEESPVDIPGASPGRNRCERRGPERVPSGGLGVKGCGCVAACRRVVLRVLALVQRSIVY